MKSLSLFTLSFISLLLLAQSSTNCSISYCTPKGPMIRFPFYLSDLGPTQPSCGYPGLGLSCSNNQTLLRLHNNGLFIVTKIDYSKQRVYLNDPNGCMVNRLITNNYFSYPPFVPVHEKMFNFYNCSSYIFRYITSYHTSIVPCLNKNNTNYGIVISPDDYFLRFMCNNYWSVSVPVNDFGYRNSTAWINRMDDILLKWHEPKCGSCEARGGTCGFQSESSSKIKCFGAQNTGLSRRVKYNIGIGVGVPGLVCLFGLICYTCRKYQAQTTNYNMGRDLENPTITHQSAHILTGLDEPTINSYQKIVLGDSGRLPKLNDYMCSICLAEYLPKETLRSIPGCNHYFHANCIDEWLKSNSTCPLCRKMHGSSVVTLASSLSLSLSPSSSTSSQ